MEVRVGWFDKRLVVFTVYLVILVTHFTFNFKVDVVVSKFAVMVVLFDKIISERVPVRNMSNYQVADLKRHLRNISHMLGGFHCNLEQRCMNVNWFSIYGRCQVLFIMKFHKLKLAKEATSRASFSPAGPKLWISLAASHRYGLILRRLEEVNGVNRISRCRESAWMDFISQISPVQTWESAPPPLSPCVLSTTPLTFFLYLSLFRPLSCGLCR